MPSNFEEFAIRVIVYEVTFYIVITVIGINILYAIVVDTFIELREEVKQYYHLIMFVRMLTHLYVVVAN